MHTYPVPPVPGLMGTKSVQIVMVTRYWYRGTGTGYCVPGYRYPGTGMHMAGKGGKIWRANLCVPMCSYGVVSNRTTYVYDIRYDASYENFG